MVQVFFFQFFTYKEVLVLPFAGGVSPPLPVVPLLFSVSYPQDRRSYYLFFNYLFFNYLYSVSRLHVSAGRDVSRLHVSAGRGGVPFARG